MNAFSFCIYGQNEWYYNGLKENLNLIKEFYPDYITYIYVGEQSRTDLLDQIRQTFDKVVFKNTGEIGHINMMYRFFAIDEPDVVSMHVRDADSRIHERDRWAIDSFMKSSSLAYTIRDNQQHGVRMMGGLWGCKKLNFSVQSLFNACRISLLQSSNEFGYDQQFLSKFMYPKLADSFIAFTNFHRLSNIEEVLPFPDFLRKDVFCGMPE